MAAYRNFFDLSPVLAEAVELPTISAVDYLFDIDYVEISIIFDKPMAPTGNGSSSMFSHDAGAHWSGNPGVVEWISPTNLSLIWEGVISVTQPVVLSYVVPALVADRIKDTNGNELAGFTDMVIPSA